MQCYICSYLLHGYEPFERASVHYLCFELRITLLLPYCHFIVHVLQTFHLQLHKQLLGCPSSSYIFENSKIIPIPLLTLSTMPSPPIFLVIAHSHTLPWQQRLLMQCFVFHPPSVIKVVTKSCYEKFNVSFLPNVYNRSFPNRLIAKSISLVVNQA